MSVLALDRGPHPVGDTVALTVRNLRHTLRRVDNLMLAVCLPVFLVLLFVDVFGGAIGAAGTGAYADYVVPGAMILVVGYGAARVAIAVSTDVRTGLVDRLRSMPVHVGGLLTGHVVAGVLVDVVSMAATVVVAPLVGFSPRAGAAGWVVALALVLLYTLALTWVAVWFGLVASGPESASGMTFVLLFLPYVSSAFVPVATMPAWLRGFARHMPITPVADAVRDLFAGRHPGSLWPAVAWCVGVLVVARVAAAVAWRRVR